MEMPYWSEMEHPVLDYIKAHIFPHLGAAQRTLKLQKSLLYIM